LISREALTKGDSTTAEILPGGGLRIDAKNNEAWEAIVKTFVRTERHIPKDGKAARLVAVDWNNNDPRVATTFLSFGTCLLKLDGLADRITAALARCKGRPEEIEDGFGRDAADASERKPLTSAGPA